jgi:hypothetical protein
VFSERADARHHALLLWLRALVGGLLGWGLLRLWLLDSLSKGSNTLRVLTGGLSFQAAVAGAFHTFTRMLQCRVHREGRREVRPDYVEERGDEARLAEEGKGVCLKALEGGGARGTRRRLDTCGKQANAFDIRRLQLCLVDGRQFAVK